MDTRKYLLLVVALSISSLAHSHSSSKSVVSIGMEVMYTLPNSFIVLMGIPLYLINLKSNGVAIIGQCE